MLQIPCSSEGPFLSLPVSRSRSLRPDISTCTISIHLVRGLLLLGIPSRTLLGYLSSDILLQCPSSLFSTVSVSPCPSVTTSFRILANLVQSVHSPRRINESCKMLMADQILIINSIVLECLYWLYIIYISSTVISETSTLTRPPDVSTPSEPSANRALVQF